jgi:hypothetical protein
MRTITPHTARQLRRRAAAARKLAQRARRAGDPSACRVHERHARQLTRDASRSTR